MKLSPRTERNLSIVLGTFNAAAAGFALYGYHNISKSPLNVVLVYTAVGISAATYRFAHEADLKVKEEKKKIK